MAARLLMFLLMGFTAKGMIFSQSINSFTITPSTINLPDIDPDSYPEVAAPTDLLVSFSITKMKKNEVWTLAIMAPGNLLSGGDSIAITNARWEAAGNITPPGTFRNGMLSQGVFLQVATGLGNVSGICTIRLFLKNYWTYATGNYNQQIILRLTVPGNFLDAQFTLATSLSERLKLAFGMTGINFPDANPDIISVIPASENPVTIVSSMRTGAGKTVRLLVSAPTALTSGSDAIAIANVTWISSGTGYVPGTMGAEPVTAGSWSMSASHSGSFSYFLANSWSINSGTYSGTATYTLASF